MTDTRTTHRVITEFSVQAGTTQQNLSRVSKASKQATENLKRTRDTAGQVGQVFGGARPPRFGGPGSTQNQTLAVGARRAQMSLFMLNRVVQDAPFGFIAVANNIDPLIQTFGFLREEMGSTGKAFKAILKSFKGPQGLFIAVATVTSLWVAFGDKIKASLSPMGDAKKEIDKITGAIRKLITVQDEFAKGQFVLTEEGLRAQMGISKTRVSAFQRALGAEQLLTAEGRGPVVARKLIRGEARERLAQMIADEKGFIKMYEEELERLERERRLRMAMTARGIPFDPDTGRVRPGGRVTEQPRAILRQPRIPIRLREIAPVSDDLSRYNKEINKGAILFGQLSESIQNEMKPAILGATRALEDMVVTALGLKRGSVGGELAGGLFRGLLGFGLSNIPVVGAVASAAFGLPIIRTSDIDKASSKRAARHDNGDRRWH